MKLRRSQAGFVGIEILLIVVVIAVAGFVGLKAYQARQAAQAPAASELAVPEAPVINSAADLTEAEQTLDQIDPEASSKSNSELDSELSAF